MIQMTVDDSMSKDFCMKRAIVKTMNLLLTFSNRNYLRINRLSYTIKDISRSKIQLIHKCNVVNSKWNRFDGIKREI